MISKVLLNFLCDMFLFLKKLGVFIMLKYSAFVLFIKQVLKLTNNQRKRSHDIICLSNFNENLKIIQNNLKQH